MKKLSPFLEDRACSSINRQPYVLSKWQGQVEKHDAGIIRQTTTLDITKIVYSVNSCPLLKYKEMTPIRGELEHPWSFSAYFVEESWHTLATVLSIAQQMFQSHMMYLR
mmetsp:Transcript_2824/g.17577  ORF Transcript_2824/g.17577 Transcript_2824/m.17577 type:complete len:109 (+) Transcript_2824:8667-8993(+)